METGLSGGRMPMRVFFCAGEPSGDLHGANLVRSLRSADPNMDCFGFGGDRMAAAGCRLLYPLCGLAVMGFLRVLTNGHRFVQLLTKADRLFRRDRPDAVVLIDYPGFNWWLARRAHARGIPVFYFVPPQIWAWGGWRVKKMRRYIDHVLTCLPFENDWYEERGVRAHFVGHPYFDELPHQQLDAEFLQSQQARPGPIIGLLPGSRTQEVEDNLDTLVGAAERIHTEHPETRFLVACYKPAHRLQVEQYLGGLDCPFIEPNVGRTPEILSLAHSCIAVSGSVGLELLYHGKPAVVVYRTGRLMLALVRRLLNVRYVSLVNLLADAELFPEFVTSDCQADAVAGHILRWLNDSGAYALRRSELAGLRQRVARPGACDRAAHYILSALYEARRAAA
jgi:lipid-A-disaccharide synthase